MIQIELGVFFDRIVLRHEPTNQDGEGATLTRILGQVGSVAEVFCGAMLRDQGHGGAQRVGI